MFTQQPWLVLHTETHKDILVSKPHSSIIRADVTLLNHLWTHMMFIYRPSSVRAPSVPFFRGPLSSNDITFFIHCRWNGRGHVCDAGWLTAEEKLDFFPFVCLGFEGGTAARWSVPSPPSRFVGLIPARRSRLGVWVFLTWAFLPQTSRLG